MPSQRKRIGFLPSEEVHFIIEKLCKTNKFSQSKITGLLVEEALRSRGALSESFSNNSTQFDDFINDSFENVSQAFNNKSSGNSDIYKVNKKAISDDIKMMHEFIEFKHFKKVMKENDNIF